MVGGCRTCWVDRVVTRPHNTHHCPKETLLNREWEKIKSGLRFPSGVLCFYCFVPYEAPFYHERAPEGSKQTPRMCEYPDALKELVYIIYENRAIPPEGVCQVRRPRTHRFTSLHAVLHRSGGWATPGRLQNHRCMPPRSRKRGVDRIAWR
jgi:hypothetical protein